MISWKAGGIIGRATISGVGGMGLRDGGGGWGGGGGYREGKSTNKKEEIARDS